MTAPAFRPDEVTAAPLTTVIEASAGTGKTTAIATLTARALAEGWCQIDQVMLVTFGRRASTELRTRLHDCLTRSIGLLRRGDSTDSTIDRLVVGDGSDASARLQRLEAALRDVDRATIATTHQFCQTMLLELGVLVDHDPHSSFGDDLRDLESEVLHDVFLRQQVDHYTHLYVSTAKEISRLVLSRVEPLADTSATDRLALAQGLREQFEKRKRHLGVYGFDDMVTRLHHALAADLTDDELLAERGPTSGAMAARRLLSRRFRWVMIDEYQDTDSLQWEIARAAFDGHSTLVLIGDPKQAIYAFRGADVNAYLRAIEAAPERRTLTTNWRSGRSIVRAVDALFDRRLLGRRIGMVPITAHHDDRGIVRDSTALAPVELRLVTTHDDVPISNERAEAMITADLVTQVRQFIGSQYVDAPFGPDSSRAGATVGASDITVLVRTNRRGERVRDALIDAGIQAVFSGTGSVFESSAAADWQRLLEAIDQPGVASIRRVALTSFFGHDVASLSQLDERGLADLAVSVKDLGRVLARSGVAATFAEVCEQHDVIARLLARPEGERVVTDLRHLSQLLHDHQRRTDCGLSGLLGWLSATIASRGEADEGTRRLESDRHAVQVMTVHRAKGLDLPIVLVPEAATWSARRSSQGSPAVVHDDDLRATINLRPSTAVRDHVAAEDADEELRLLYVALTRAKYALRVWWAPSTESTPQSPLHRLLGDRARTGEAARVPQNIVDLDDHPGLAISRAWPDAPWTTVRVVEPEMPESAEIPEPSGALVESRVFSRTIDQHWRRTSYSALTSDIHELPPLGSQVSDEPDLEADDPLGEGGRSDLAALTEAQSEPLASPMAAFPGGTLFGTLVHAVLEDLDPAHLDLARELQRASALACAEFPLEGVDAASLAAGLELVVTTPLGPLAEARSLRDYPTGDRLPELDFELPLADSSSSARSVGDLARAFTAHLPADDLLADYGRRLGETVAADTLLAGWLTGSIDAVLRHTASDGSQRHLVIDYKTNKMPLATGELLTVQHYGSAAMAEAMMQAHYPLQALLYSVALHRFLGHRLPDYDPAVHLGGVGYLFVRGMAGDGVEQPHDMPWGVFTWHPPTGLVLEASQIVGGQ